MESTDKLKVAVIGAGSIARKVHIPCFQKNPNARVEAIVDENLTVAEKAARKFNIPQVYSSLEDLFDHAEIDVISICTPPNSHMQIAIEAFQNGANVLCEKPLADNSENGRKMVEAAENAEKTLMVGLNRRFYQTYQKAKNMVTRGSIGHPYLAEYCNLQSSPLTDWGKSAWYYQEDIGGAVRDLGQHAFDILNWFLGQAKAITAQCILNPNVNVDEACTATVEYEDRKTGVAMVSWLANGNIENLNIHGTSRDLFVSPKFFLDVNPSTVTELELWKSATSLARRRGYGALTGKRPPSTHQLEIDYFVNCLQKKDHAYPDGWDGLKALLLTEAALSSAKKKKEVTIPSIE